MIIAAPYGHIKITIGYRKSATEEKIDLIDIGITCVFFFMNVSAGICNTRTDRMWIDAVIIACSDQAAGTSAEIWRLVFWFGFCKFTEGSYPQRNWLFLLAATR